LRFFKVGADLDLGLGKLTGFVKQSEYAKTFFFEDWRDKKFFWKQFLSGAFITIVMTGLDQDMMQKNLSCRNLKEAQLNMFTFSGILIVVNLLFLSLGVLLYHYAEANGLNVPTHGDELYPSIALSGEIGLGVAILFILGLIAAAYSSADSALTALTTSVCIDLLNLNENIAEERKPLRMRVHLIMSAVLFSVIMLFSLINDQSVISDLFTAAGYTYGPLLGLYAFGLLTKRKVKDKWVPLICISSPILTYLIQVNSKFLLNGYEFSFEILILNGILSFTGLLLIAEKHENKATIKS
jgi:Na+/proline symporter